MFHHRGWYNSTSSTVCDPGSELPPLIGGSRTKRKIVIEMEKKKIERVSYKQLTANRRIRCVNSSNTCRAGKCSNLYDPRRQGALRWYSATSRGTVNGYVYQVPGTLEYVSRGRLIVYPSSRRAARGVEDGRAFRRKQKTTGTLSFA